MYNTFRAALLWFCLIPLISGPVINKSCILAQNKKNDFQKKLEQLSKAYSETYKDSLRTGEKYAQEALNLSRELNDPSTETEALIYLGRVKNIYNKLSEAKIYLFQAFVIAKKLGNKYLESKCCTVLGNTYYCLNLPDSSLFYSRRGFEIASSLNNNSLLRRATINLAHSYFMCGDKSNALKYCGDALTLNKDNKSNFAEIHQLMGLIYSDLGDFENSLKHFSQALELFNELKNLPTVAYIYSNVASLFQNYSDIYKSTDYNLKALEIFRGLKDYRGMGYILNNLGTVQLQLKDNTKALKYFRESLSAKSQTEDKQGIIFTLNNIAEIFLNKNLPNSANEYINRSLKYSEELGNKLSLANSYQLLGEYYREKKKYPDAIAALNKSLMFARSYNNRPMVESLYENFSNLYNEIGDKPNAFYYLRQKNAQHDSINSEKAQKYIADMLVKYETKNKEEQLKQLVEKRLALESGTLYQRILIIGIILVGVLTITVLIYRYRRKVISLMSIIKIISDRAIGDKRRLKGVIKIIEQKPENSEIKHIDSKTTGDLLLRLKDLMINEKIYLNPAVSQSLVAKMLSTNTAYLSNIINDQLSSNFSNYINQYRIEEAKKMILDNRQNILTFEGIAQSVGFNSKSAFNKAFKKFTGKTPSQFATEAARNILI
jgi:AraC-like DNA-binding protein/tetratricopeptide (TPR) repeat protein